MEDEIADDESVTDNLDAFGAEMDVDQQEADEAFLFGPDSESEIKDDEPEKDDPEQECKEEAFMKMPHDPSDPTPEERERHNKTHTPYRSWCSVCVRARGKEDKHFKQAKQERELGLPKVSMDYAQIEDKVEVEIEESEETDAVHKKRLLIGRDRWTKSTFSHLVKCKGLGDQTIVQKVAGSVESLGYRKLTIKT